MLVMDREVTINIELVHGFYRVSGELSKQILWNRIRGYKWYGDTVDGKEVKFHLVPKAKRKDLWAILRIYAKGQLAIGPKGVFEIK